MRLLRDLPAPSSRKSFRIGKNCEHVPGGGIGVEDSLLRQSALLDLSIIVAPFRDGFPPVRLISGANS